MSIIKVLHVFSKVKLGGVSSQYSKLSGYIDSNKVKQFVYSIRKPSVFHSEISRNVEEVYSFDYELGSSRLELIKHMCRVVRDNGIDIIHSHLTQGDLYASIVGRICGVKVVSTFHSARSRASSKKEFVSRKAFIHRNVDKFVAVSHYAKKVNRDLYRLKDDDVCVIYNGIEPISDRKNCRDEIRQRYGVRQDEILLLNVGRLNEAKNQQILISSMNDINHAIGECALIIAGEGEERTSLEAMVNKMGLKNQVQLPGYVEDIPSLMQASDIFVFPSKIESFGNSVLEAMLNRLPVVASRRGAIPELVEHGRSGYLFDLEDSSEMVENIATMASDSSLREKMVNTAYSDAVRKFDIHESARMFEDLYQKVAVSA